jgi:hypothetical protein
MTILNAFFDRQVLWWEHDTQKIPGGYCVWFDNSKPVWQSVACLEAGQPHLHPNLADWKSNIRNTAVPKASKGVVVCALEKEKRQGPCFTVRSVMLVCASWTALRTDHVSRRTKTAACSSVKCEVSRNAFMYSLNRKHSFCA